MVPESEWRGEGQNLDKRTARKVHAEYFKKTIAEIRKRFLAEFKARDQENNADVASDAATGSASDQIHVYVRKRPLLPHELQKHEFDVISAVGDREIVIHECKMHNDMRHKYVVSHLQRFSKCYDESAETEQVYQDTTKDLVVHAMEGGKSVCMMYGQTGSGKTYTMGGMLHLIAEDLFTEAVGSVDFTVSVRAIEIAGSNCYDLLNDHTKVTVCEDAEGIINLLHCTETEPTESTDELMEVLEEVKNLRTTEATTVNSQSSRSHLVVYVNLRRCPPKGAAQALGDLYGQVVLLDLAGSERNEDSFYHDAARRKEAIEINKSHMALKECVRAIGREDTTGYVPYRASVLTRILKDCLWSKNSRASVIATISPLSIDTEHTLHSLLCAGQMLEDNPVISTERTDVKEGVEEKVVVPIREWDNAMVHEWLTSTNKGACAKYAKNLTTSMDGRLLTRFTVQRFTQICDGNAEDATRLFKALRAEMARQDKILRAKRLTIAARHHNTRGSQGLAGN